MKTTQLVFSITVIILCNSCRKDIIAPLKEALLKTRYYYSTISDETLIKKYEYQYDNTGKLERINHIGGSSQLNLVYEHFKYNMKNELENHYTYHYCCDSFGWLLSDSTHYCYENGQLTLEETYYPTPNSYQVSYQYEYDKSNLVRKYRYDKQEFVHCITYDYSNGVCIRETRFSDPSLKNIGGYTIHHYNGTLLIRSEKYTSQNQNFQVITYIYDNTGNLIIEESIKTWSAVAAPLEYFCRYEYY